MTGLSLNWLAVCWIAMGAICLTFGVVHLILWIAQRSKLHYLFFAIAALASALFAVFELRMMQTTSLREMAFLLRWGHFILFFEIVALVGFIHWFFGTGRAWLAWAVVASRGLVLVVNFASEVNANYTEIISLGVVEILGSPTTVVTEGVIHPWSPLPPLTMVVFCAYVVDTSIRAWRRGGVDERHPAVSICGSLLLTVALAVSVSSLKHQGILLWPYMVTPAFLWVILAIGYELARALLRSAQVAEDLKARSERVRQLEQRLELATEAADVGAWEWNVGRRSIWLSDRARALLGLQPAGEVDPSLFLDRLVEAGGGGVRDRLLHPRDRSGPIRAELRIAGPEGHVRWVELYGAPDRGRHDGVGAAQGLLIDVTQRKQEVERFRRLADASPYAMLVVDRNGRIAEANARADALFEYGQGKLQGLDVEALVPVPSRSAHLALRDGFLHAPASRAMRSGADVTALTASGRTLMVEVWLTRVPFDGDAMVVAHIIDNTARRAAELELTLQREELAHLSRVAVMGALSASLAHELNQPLAAILANAQATQRLASTGQVTPDWLDDVLGDIVDETKRAGEIIRRLRAMLRRDEPERVGVDLNEIVVEVLRMIRSNLSIRRATVTTDLDPGLPLILGDRVQLQQVLINLLLNGVEAMDAQVGPHELAVCTEAGTDGRVRVRVIDRGSGIAPEQLARVFEPFFTTKQQGLGLGLAVCRTIVEYHGGTIHASNNVGAPGATFEITLPVLPADRP